MRTVYKPLPADHQHPCADAAYRCFCRESQTEHPMNRPLVDLLHAEQLSLAVETSDGRRKRYRSRGVSDLYGLLTAEPAILNRASVADKVVGKGAAALMALGNVSEVWADTISRSGLAVLRQAGIQVEYTTLVPYIIKSA